MQHGRHRLPSLKFDVIRVIMNTKSLAGDSARHNKVPSLQTHIVTHRTFKSVSSVLLARICCT